MEIRLVNNSIALEYKNSSYSYVFNPGKYLFELWGASGGGLQPGFGAYVSGSLRIMTKTTLHIYIGQKGNDTVAGRTFNGGGYGNSYGSSGGGSTDIRLKDGDWDDFESLKSRIIVAGAGGGSSSHTSYESKAGDAGIFEGYEGSSKANKEYTVTNAQGGKQKEGGSKGSGRTPGSNGEFGKGGDSKGELNLYACGGGSGYFGGGGGAINDYAVGSGAGGSSYVSGLFGCKSITESSSKTSYSFSDLPFHYSNLVFSNITYKDGSKTEWDDNGKVVITKLPSCFTNSKALPAFTIFVIIFVLVASK